jgi:hypothetical protein
MAVVGTASLLGLNTRGSARRRRTGLCGGCSVACADVNLIQTRPPTSQKPGGEVRDSRGPLDGNQPHTPARLSGAQLANLLAKQRVIPADKPTTGGKDHVQQEARRPACGPHRTGRRDVCPACPGRDGPPRGPVSREREVGERRVRCDREEVPYHAEGSRWSIRPAARQPRFRRVSNSRIACQQRPAVEERPSRAS